MSNVVSLKTGEPVVPDFITRVDISKMSDEKLDELIKALSERRMSSFIVYEQTVKDTQAINEEKAKVRLEKEVDMTFKALEAVNNALDKLETRIHKMRGLRIQAGMSPL